MTILEMSRWRFAVTGSICLLLSIPAILTCAQTPRVKYHADLDGDGLYENISIELGEPFQLRVSHGTKVLWSGVPAAWKAWKLAIADVDGDGRLDILVGLSKSTRFFRTPHNCLFIYGWDGWRGYPKWLGSSLSRPFTDFQIVKRDGAPTRLAAIEIGRDERRSLGLYSWNGFGFSLEARTGDWASADSLAVSGNSVSLNADGQSVTVPIMR